MIRTLLLSTALAVTMPAFAQQAASPVAPAQPQAAPANPASPGDSVAAIVEAEFPAYDGNNDSQLDKAEFSRWMTALKGQEMKTTGQTLTPEEVTAWSDGALKTADVDKNLVVSKAELVSYLSGGAR